MFSHHQQLSGISGYLNVFIDRTDIFLEKLRYQLLR